ncbi:MAG: hypothetical protein JO180_09275 [Gemmatirosa sp.]|nr:hypothetical protein [Gemmatirosa sp.]
MQLNSVVRIGGFLLIASCGQVVGLASPDAHAAPDLLLSRETVAGVTVVLSPAPSTVAPGDTIRLVATARNATRQRIQIGLQCGPPMDVSIATPDGRRRSVLADLLGGNGAFTCELGPYHFVEPDSTRATAVAWVVPSTRGEYVAVAGLRRADGLGNLSEPIRFQVR